MGFRNSIPEIWQKLQHLEKFCTWLIMETIDLPQSPSDIEVPEVGIDRYDLTAMMEESGYKVEQPEQSGGTLLESATSSAAGDSGNIVVDIDGAQTCDQEWQEHNSNGEDSILSSLEANEEKEPLSYELEQGYRILREIMTDSNKSVNWAFMDPVNIEESGLEDYYERIKNPIWLKKGV